jgi:parallel beta-helix repeat protein
MNNQLRWIAMSTVAVLAAPIFLFVTSAPANAVGTGYWVDGTASGCSDTGAGTQTAPFCTISAGTKKAVNAGDVVHVAPGTYREQVTINGSGTSADPITVEGDAPGVTVLGTRAVPAASWSPTATSAWSTSYAPPSAPRQVFLDGRRLAAASSATTTTNGSWFYDTTAKILYVDNGGSNPADGHQVEAGAQSYGLTASSRHDVVVRNLMFQRQNFAGVRLLSSSAITVDTVAASESASNGILIDTCTAGVVVRDASVDGSISTGIRLTATTGAKVTGSTSHGNGLHGIGLSTSSGNIIDGNTTYDNVALSPTATGVGIDVNTSSPDNTVRDNTTYHNQDSGIQVYSSSHRTLVVRNISYGNGDHGFDTLSSKSVRYVNNTSYGNRRDGISVEGNSTDASLANNLLVDNGMSATEYDLYVDSSSTSGFSADYDMAYNHALASAVKVAGTTYKKLSDYADASGQEKHGASVDPDFADAASSDFRLTPGSVAVDSADAGASGFTDTDRDGNGPTDDAIVPDTGAGTPPYADRGALELQPVAGSTDYAPHAALVVDPSTLNIPPSVLKADASGSSDADVSGIASYTFDFGDGTVVGPQTSPTAKHSYHSTGTFPVTVIVQDGNGLQDTAARQVVVSNRDLQTYHVEQTSPACSDAGPGSTATPFCTIGAATRKVLAGDTALVGPGQYREQVAVPTSGEEGAPITIRATSPSTVLLGSNDVSDVAGWTATGTTAWQHAYAPTAAPTQVWLDGQPLKKAASATQTTKDTWFYDTAAATLYVDVGGANPAVGHTVSAGARNYGFLLRGVSDLVLSGFVVRQTNLAGGYLDSTQRVALTGIDVAQAGTYGVTVDNSTDATLSGIQSNLNGSVGIRMFTDTDSAVRDSVTHQNNFHGVSVQSGTRVTVSGVTTYGNKRVGSRIAAGIDVSQSSKDTMVESSTSYDNDDSGAESYTGSTGTIFRRNVIYDNGDHGIDNSGAPGSVVIGNTVVGNGTAGINFEGGSSGATARDNLTLDNAVGSTRTIGEIRVDESSASGTSLDRDLVFQTSGGPLFEWASQAYTTITSYQAASGQEQTGRAADPQFADAAARNLHLTSGSPAVDAADTTPTSWSPADRDGQTPVDQPTVTNTGNGPSKFADLGAYEYVGPVAAGTVNPATGAVPLTVTVDASDSTALGAPISGYKISCDNGTTFTEKSGTCIYPQTGTFKIRITVTDDAGLTDSWSKSVSATANHSPIANLVATPKRAYVPQKVTLDASGSSDPDGSIASYSFNCGNGQTGGAQADPTTTCDYAAAGNFTASVTVRDPGGLTNKATTNVTILADLAPTAVLRLSNNNISRGQSITADGSDSTDADNTPIATYTFDCGNGVVTAPQTSPKTTCSYPTTGTFHVRLTVTDTGGKTGSATKDVKVK